MYLNKSKLTIITIIFCKVLCVFVFIQIFANSDSQQFYDFSTSKNIEALHEEDITYVNGFHSILQESRNPILNEFLISNNPSKCSQDFQYFIENLELLGWATQMLDAYGKPESGIFIGNTKWLGEYDECLRVYAPPEENTNVGNFHGRYCTLTIPFRLQDRVLPFKVGVCLPDSCNPSGFISDYMQINLNGSFAEFAEEINSVLKETKISCQQTEGYYFDDIAVMLLISLFGLLAMIGSLITVYKYLTKGYFEEDRLCKTNAFENPSVNGHVGKLSHRRSEYVMINGNLRKSILPVWLEKHNSFFNCFCFLTNGEKILNTSNAEGQQLPFLHGIRFLTMSWIILGHTFIFSLNSIRNPVEALKVVDKWYFQIVICCYTVDAFFLLSGFLLAYNFFKKSDKNNGKINWVSFYVHRYVRLTPVYMIVLAFFTTLTAHLGSGPLWSPSQVETNCKESWWWNMLYINNFRDIADQCMGYAWYLANDMQFYVISPLFLVTLCRWPKIGYSVMGLFFCITFISNFALTYHYNLFTGLGNIAQLIAHHEQSSTRWTQFFDLQYTKPYNRVGPYLVGISLAYYVYKRKQTDCRKLSWVILSVGWIVATGVTLACIFGLYHRSPTVVVASFCNALKHVMFACGVSWVIFLCITGQAGAVSSILSWKVWIPLSRLTFCAYLVHPIIMGSYYSSMKILLEFSHRTMIIMYLGFLMLSYGIAFLTSLLFEWPAIRLEMLIRNKFTS